MTSADHDRRWRRVRLAAAGGGALAVAFALSSCGGGGGGGGTPVASAATIDSASLAGKLGDIDAFLPLCNPALGTIRERPMAAGGYNLVARLQLLRSGMVQPDPRRRALALTATKPADVLGSCGGRYGYTDYSHASGVTRGTLTFTDFCTNDTVSGERTVVNGAVAFVETATPTATGPVTNRLEADSPAGVRAVVRSTANAVLSDVTTGFSGFVMTVGNPGGNSSAAAPDRLQLAEIKVTQNTTGKTYRQTGWTITDFVTPSGGEQTSLSGRGYRSNGDYYDISTPTPLLFDASGNTLGGSLSFAGANGTQAVATLVPGATLQASLTVNGVPMPALPACAR